MVSGSNKKKNESKMENEVLERIALLESQVTSLQEEMRKTKDEKDQSNKTVNLSISSEESCSSIEAKDSIKIVEDIGEINANARKPRNLRLSDSSLLTKRINADDDFKV